MRLKKFIKQQEKLAQTVVLKDGFETRNIKLIGGADQAFLDDVVLSGIVVIDKDFNILEKKFAKVKTNFPYIPGLLSYREGPSIVKAFKKLKNKPDVLMIDGNGILHPRKIGLASHVGALLNEPAIGIAKSLLCGEVKRERVFIDKRQVGWKLKTKKACNPIYVSPGHKVSLKTSKKIVEKYIKNYKLPEPQRLAHNYTNGVKNEINNLSKCL